MSAWYSFNPRWFGNFTSGPRLSDTPIRTIQLAKAYCSCSGRGTLSDLIIFSPAQSACAHEGMLYVLNPIRLLPGKLISTHLCRQVLRATLPQEQTKNVIPTRRRRFPRSTCLIARIIWIIWRGCRTFRVVTLPNGSLIVFRVLASKVGGEILPTQGALNFLSE
ncbi:MAG: hypothetical protein FE78DRAFT_343222 [Acidomyces sp. 'richmondensis']|nr:MAG: hypothetical protein FE78DRAFT_343222 [Acidomyces sp. 'richmondensis']